MYSVKSYYDQNSESMGNITSSVKSAIGESLKEIINAHQLELIEELTAFIDHLNKALVSSFSSVKIKATFTEPNMLRNVQQQQFTFRKNKVSILSVQEMDLYYPAALSVFEAVEYPVNMITLFFGYTEELWLKNLARIGVRASILFEGLNDGINTPICTVKLQASSSRKSLVAEVNGTKLSGHISVWKLLGVLTSLYPTTPDYPDICTHIDYWLLLINDVLSNRNNEDSLCRRMSMALSNHNYLVPNVAATLADVLAYSVMKQSYYANNIELWLRRMDELFQ
ncbi:Dolichyl-diphosphooligosaccharide--protein glycosyltransferasesubunit [Dirofilaria immitis]